MSILGMCTDAGIVRKQSIQVLTPACFPEICHFFLNVYNRGNITYLRFSLCLGGMQVMNYSLNALRLSMCSNLDASSSVAGGKCTCTLLCAKAEYLCSWPFFISKYPHRFLPRLGSMLWLEGSFCLEAVEAG